MKHPEEGRLQALMDQEMRDDEAREVRAHVDGCDACRATSEALAARTAAVSAALAVLDPTPPAERVRARILAEAEPPRRREPRRWLGIPVEALPRAAAVTLLLAGGVAAAALPDSPVRRWLADEGDDAPAAATTATADEAVPAADDEVGVRVSPAEGRLRIVVDGLPSGAEVVVTAVEGAATAGAYAPDGARFRTGDGLLEVGSPRGPVRVELPSGVEAVVSVGGRVIARGGPAGLLGPEAVQALDASRVRFVVP